MSLHLGPLGLPELIHSPAVKAVLSLGETWLLTPSSELQLGLASLEAMWPPKLAVPGVSPDYISFLRWPEADFTRFPLSNLCSLFAAFRFCFLYPRHIFSSYLAFR